jgi:hypothetical protein
VISGTIAANAAGTYSVTVTAFDENVASAQIQFAWTVGGAAAAHVLNSNPHVRAPGSLFLSQPTALEATNLLAGLPIDPLTGMPAGSNSGPTGKTDAATTPVNGSGTRTMSFSWHIEGPAASTKDVSQQNHDATLDAQLSAIDGDGLGDGLVAGLLGKKHNRT